MDIDELFDTTRPVNLATKSAIYVWGYNQSGQTGRKGKECQLRIPRQLPPELFGCPAGVNSRWLDVSCGREHTAAVASDGSLFTWGIIRLSPMPICFWVSMFLSFDISEYHWKKKGC